MVREGIIPNRTFTFNLTRLHTWEQISSGLNNTWCSFYPLSSSSSGCLVVVFLPRASVQDNVLYGESSEDQMKVGATSSKLTAGQMPVCVSSMTLHPQHVFPMTWPVLPYWKLLHMLPGSAQKYEPRGKKLYRWKFCTHLAAHKHGLN